MPWGREPAFSGDLPAFERAATKLYFLVPKGHACGGPVEFELQFRRALFAGIRLDAWEVFLPTGGEQGQGVALAVDTALEIRCDVSAAGLDNLLRLGNGPSEALASIFVERLAPTPGITSPTSSTPLAGESASTCVIRICRALVVSSECPHIHPRAPVGPRFQSCLSSGCPLWVRSGTGGDARGQRRARRRQQENRQSCASGMRYDLVQACSSKENTVHPHSDTPRAFAGLKSDATRTGSGVVFGLRRTESSFAPRKYVLSRSERRHLFPKAHREDAFSENDSRPPCAKHAGYSFAGPYSFSSSIIARPIASPIRRYVSALLFQ
jgi:hypothetical protein